MTGCVLPRIASVALLLAVLCGCGRDESAAAPSSPAPEPPKKAVVPRMQDPEYRKSLDGVQEKRKGIATRRRKVVERMEELIARARAALPADVTEEQVLHELQDNPQKYPGWRELSLKLRDVNAQAEKELADARRLVMARVKKDTGVTGDFKRGGSK